MSLSRQGKAGLVEDLNRDFKQAQALVIAQYRGIRVEAMTRLRKKAREEKVSLRVIKNTLARLAVKGTDFEPLANFMKGALIYSYSHDPVVAAKILHDFSRQDSSIVLEAGFYEGKLLDADQVRQLASIPSRAELLSKLLFVIQAPVSGMARAVAALAEQRTESL